MRALRVGYLLLVAAGSVAAATESDTGQLAAHLKSLRGHPQLSREEYRDLRNEYLAWIDTRVRAGRHADDINQELKDAGLLFQWLRNIVSDDDLKESKRQMFESHAGWVEGARERAIRNSNDLFVVEATIDQGVCAEDVTASLYEKKSLRRVAEINAGSGSDEHGYYLLSIDAGGRGSDGMRIVASRWVASNCMSRWNGELIRIDRLDGASVRNLLSRDLYAAVDGNDDVSAEVRSNVVTFRYDGGIGDMDLLSASAIARYRVTGDEVTREAPVALTRAGFIREWLAMRQTDAARWAERQALAMRGTLAQELHGNLLEWVRVANCGGSPPVWGVAATIGKSNRPRVFRIRGNRATELRMLSIGDKVTESCPAEDIRKSLASVGAELPW